MFSLSRTARASSRLALLQARPTQTHLLRTYADQASKEDQNAGKVKQDSPGHTSAGPKDGAHPKILDAAPPAEPSEDVKQHNKEFEQRHDRSSNKINSDGTPTVGKGFWSGT